MSDHGEGSEIALLKAENARLRKIILEAAGAFQMIVDVTKKDPPETMRRMQRLYLSDDEWFVRGSRTNVSFEAWLASHWLDEYIVKGGT